MKNWIPTTMSIVAIGLALVAIAKVSPIQGDMDFDYYGVAEAEEDGGVGDEKSISRLKVIIWH